MLVIIGQNTRFFGVGNDISPISSSGHVEFVSVESKKSEAKCAKKEMIVDIKLVQHNNIYIYFLFSDIEFLRIIFNYFLFPL